MVLGSSLDLPYERLGAFSEEMQRSISLFIQRWLYAPLMLLLRTTRTLMHLQLRVQFQTAPHPENGADSVITGSWPRLEAELIFAILLNTQTDDQSPENFLHISGRLQK